MKITDGNVRMDYVARMGEVPAVTSDNQWHHLSFNLHKLIDADEHEKAIYRGEHLILQDIGFNWHEAGTTLYLDNVCISGPVGSDAPFESQGIHESGIRDYAFCMDEEFDTDARSTPQHKAPPLLRTSPYGRLHFLMRGA